MRKLFITLSIAVAGLAVSGTARAQGYFASGFGFAPMEASWTSTRHFSSPAKYDARVDASLVKAANIAEHNAAPHSTLRCWHFVKDALVASGAVRSRPASAYASQAGSELTGNYGFVQLATRNPYHAPVGAVIVYGGHGAGHVELRTPHGFVSDYRSSSACNYRVIGIYAKLAS